MFIVLVRSSYPECANEPWVYTAAAVLRYQYTLLEAGNQP